MENSLALFPTTFLWFLHCIFLGKLDRRGCRVFSSFLGYLTLGDGLRSRASPAHHLLLSRKRVGKYREAFAEEEISPFREFRGPPKAPHSQVLV